MQPSKGRFIYRAALFRVSYYQDLFKERLKMEKIRQLSRIFPDIVKSCHNFYCDSPFSCRGDLEPGFKVSSQQAARRSVLREKGPLGGGIKSIFLSASGFLWDPILGKTFLVMLYLKR